MARTPELAELLENAGWLRKLAAGLVGPVAAEDLVQDTWVQALRSPPPPDTPRGPWLARVTRNLFRMDLRRREVRRRHAAALAADGGAAAPDPEELLARLETQRLLARIVADLAEPFRTTVLLRYYEGMSAARIARAAGVPAGTVRWRLKEGLDRIRAALDAAHGQDDRRWRRALLPLAQGAWIMKKTGSIVAIVLLLLALGATGIYVARRGGKGGTADRPAAPGAPAAGAATADPRERPAPPAIPASPQTAGPAVAAPLMPARVVPDPSSAAGTFAGRVLNWSTGRGVAGAQITFNVRGAALAVATNADGDFLFEPPAPGRHMLQLVTADDYLPFAPAWDASPIALVSRPGVRVEGIVVYLSPALDYTATVLDPSGKPVPKAKARVINARGGEQTLEHMADEFVTDDKGQFVFHAPDFALVEARHPDWAPGRATMSGSVLLSHQMTINLGPREGNDTDLGKARIHGQVVDGAGAPVPGAIVTAVALETSAASSPGRGSPLPRADDMTDAEGRFELAGLDPGLHDVTAHADGYAVQARKKVPTGDTPIVIKLETGAALAGRVLDPDGRPVPAFTLQVRRVTNGMLEERLLDRSIIDADGRFELRDLVPGPVRLSVAAHGFAPVGRIAADVPAPPAVGGPVEIRLPRGGRLIGRVIDRATHDPLEYARVSVEAEVGDGSTAIPFGASTTAAADGSFELGGLAPGKRVVIIAAHRHHIRSIGFEVADGGVVGPLEIDLAATAEGEEPRLEFVGIGVQFESTSDSLIINKVFPQGGAAEAGLVPGDEILAVDGTPVDTIGLQGAVPLIRGPEGTTVRLTLRRAGAPAPVDVVVLRKRLSV